MRNTAVFFGSTDPCSPALHKETLFFAGDSGCWSHIPVTGALEAAGARGTPASIAQVTAGAKGTHSAADAGHVFVRRDRCCAGGSRFSRPVLDLGTVCAPPAIPSWRCGTGMSSNCSRRSRGIPNFSSVIRGTGTSLMCTTVRCEMRFCGIGTAYP